MHITLLKQHGFQGFTLFRSHKQFLIETDQKVIPYKNILSIDRSTGKTTQINLKSFTDKIKQQKYVKKSIWALFGMIIVQESPYLAIVTQAKRIKSSKSSISYQIENIQFIPFDNKKQLTPSATQIQILTRISLQIITSNFYFSYTQNLTQSFRNCKPTKTPRSKYFWNQKATQFIKFSGLQQPWIIPIIQGIIRIVEEKNFQYQIIARRSKYMAGTRYNCRGIDYDGQPANFVQIQERILYKNYQFSYIILRGSVPIFWKQQNGFSGISFTEKQQRDLKGLSKHYEQLIQTYKSPISTINLLSQQKAQQKNLSCRFLTTLQQYNKKQNYFEFDFNNGNEMLNQNINSFILTFTKNQNNFQCFDNLIGKSLNTQNIVYRVNCLDCVDRTNVICSRIGEFFVNNVMHFINQKNQNFISKYFQVWAELGNKISKIYCGTESVAEHIIFKKQSTAWSSITSSFRSVNRFINASQTDSTKQQCINYVLHQHVKSKTHYFRDNIRKYWLKQQQYCRYSQARCVFVTYNVAQLSSPRLIPSQINLFQQQIFGQNRQIIPQIIFITLQQIVQLSSYNVVTGENQQAKKNWEKVFLDIFNDDAHGYTYLLYFSQALVGIQSMLFVRNTLDYKQDYLNKTKKIFSHQVKNGYAGNFGNKGSIVFGFSIQDTQIIYFASHLAAHDNKHQQRSKDIKNIFDSLLNDINTYRTYNNCDLMFFTGDLNFRLSCSDEQARQIIHDAKNAQASSQFNQQKSSKDNFIQNLLKYDQFFQFHSKGEYLKHFSEFGINFYPTYKYRTNEDLYDAKRKPGYCDRILHYENKPNRIKCISYKSIDSLLISDHRPVVAHYKLRIKQQDKVKKQQLINNYLLSNMKPLQTKAHYLPVTRFNYK